MKFILIWLFIFSPLTKPKSDVALIQNLEKRAERSTSKNLEYVHKMVKKYPKSAVPYFYAAKWHFEEFNQAKTLKAGYSSISSALSYASKYDRRSKGVLDEKLGFGAFENELKDSTNRYCLKLLEVGDTVRYRNMKVKYDRLFPSDENTTKPGGAPNSSNDSKTTANLTSRFVDGQYFGMPMGIENIKAFNEQFEIEMVALINKARKSKGMQPLVMQPDLVRAARYHAFDMATQNYFNHQSYDLVNGKLEQVGTTFPRIKSFYKGSFVNSENIAAGSNNAKDCYEQWYNSPGHYDNMFNPSSKWVGLGLAYNPESTFGYYWVFCTAL